MLQTAIPVIRVSDSAAAERFYCDKLGFRRIFAYRPDATRSDPCYFGVVRDGARLHLSSFPGDGPTGVSVQILADDVDSLLEEFRKAEVQNLNGPFDQTWGNRELMLKDLDGNGLVFAQQTE